MEQLDYLIRTLTYKRSCLELELKKLQEQGKYDFSNVMLIKGKIEGLQIALTEIYGLVLKMTQEKQVKLIEALDTLSFPSDREIVDNPNG